MNSYAVTMGKWVCQNSAMTAHEAVIKACVMRLIELDQHPMLIDSFEIKELPVPANVSLLTQRFDLFAAWDEGARLRWQKVSVTEVRA